MTPARTNNRTGSFIIDRVFANVGRIRRSLNTEDVREWRRRVSLIERIHKQEHYDLLRAFARGDFEIEYLIELDRKGELAIGLSTLSLRAPLWDTVEKLLPTLAESTATTARYATSWKALQRKGRRWLGDRATVADLARVEWKKLKAEWNASGTDWMQMRRAVGRFLTIHLGDVYHPFRRQVMRKDNFPTARERKRKPSLSLEQFKAKVERVQEPARPAFWTILLVGLRLGEYVGALPEHLNESTHTLFLPARKTDDSDGLMRIDPRIWHIVEAAIPTKFSYRYLQEMWLVASRAAGGPSVTIHDLRHIHGQFAIDAGVPESKVQASFRHKSPGQTRDYVMTRDTGIVSAALADLVTAKPTRKRA